MRILIVSDTHGRHSALDRALEEAGRIDVFIHLGDVEGGEDYINAVVDCEERSEERRVGKECRSRRAPYH